MRNPYTTMSIPSDITMKEIRSAIGDNASKQSVEDFLFDNLNDDFSLDVNLRDYLIEWYHHRLNK